MEKGKHSNHDHDHDHHGDHGSSAGRLKFAIALLSLTFIAEVAGGFLTRSLALLADAGHLFLDLFALTLSLVATRLALLPATSTKTYGWHRAEIFAALINGALLLGMSLLLFREAWHRFHAPAEILAEPMLIVALIGLAVNIIIALRLHGHHEGDLNLTSAYFHVLGDTGASLGVVVAAAVIALTGWTAIDSLISAGIGVLILIGSVRLIFNAGHIFLESVPKGLSLEAVANAIEEVDGVNSVHDVHIWAVCSHIINLSCHVNIDPKGPQFHDQIVRSITEMLQRRFCIIHPTIQVDYESCSDEVVTQDMNHQVIPH